MSKSVTNKSVMGAAIEDNSLAAFLLSLAQNGLGTYTCTRQGNTDILEFPMQQRFEAKTIIVKTTFIGGEGTHLDENFTIPIPNPRDDEYIFSIENADSENFSH